MLRVLLMTTEYTINESTARRFPIGQTVKLSGYALESSRMYWLGLGHEPAKTRARDNYHAKQAARGIVTAHCPTKHSQAAIEITWDSGPKSTCLDYMVEPCEAQP